MNLDEQARLLLSLHKPGDPVILPTVWDAWSAEVAADAGFSALTVGSHPAAASVGAADGEGLTLDEMLAQVRRVTAAVDLPVSADLESGYGAEPERIIEGLLGAGAVGFNLEDTVHSEGGRIRTDAEHADLVAALRAASDAAGVAVVINARTDVIMDEVGPAEDRVERAVRKLRLAAEAGASVLYPIGLHPPHLQRRLTEELPLPVNALGRPVGDSRAGLAAAGVARVSFGPFLQRELGVRAGEILAAWR